LEVSPTLLSLLDNFKAPIRFAFAYGSGVFSQNSATTVTSPHLEPGVQSNARMIDLIFGVTHPPHWHSINLSQNPHHYAKLARWGGSSIISTLQDASWAGAGVYYNPYVEIQLPPTDTVGSTRVMVKYGVVCINRLCSDLTQWDSFYLAGRMHKPVAVLREDARVALALRINRLNALRLAILLHYPKESISIMDLYMTLAELSYIGDFRMLRVGGKTMMEHPKKIQNVVTHQSLLFDTIYHTYLRELSDEGIIFDQAQSVIRIDRNPRAVAHQFSKLPKTFVSKVKAQIGHQSIIQETEESYKLQVASEKLPSHLKYALSQTVRGPALRQAIKGIFSAGISRSFQYAKAKISKSLSASKS
jgi:translocator assembly and maintenance protein 41